ncbi:hypothetical protein FNH22_03435 [Fulvivirga sp. M361]|uniref:DUF6520 family protein n=1 Tax=Fulvivirga sp. M361 TaxID=2594266 RepID=UPI00117B33FF|nr:DUF6520 family protein [Fulvivirga sp. M361]TRX61841.1 hypothetical protein FNH22_03435 [Fulvivirga sp. M361]
MKKLKRILPVLAFLFAIGLAFADPARDFIITPSGQVAVVSELGPECNINNVGPACTVFGLTVYDAVDANGNPINIKRLGLLP